MSGILERTVILGKVKLSGKAERFVPFPWEEVGAGGDVYGWEPAEWQPMGRIADINRLDGKVVGQLPSKFSVMEFSAPFFYDTGSNGAYKTLLHGGFVQFV